jgi:hypothetical protein
MSNDFQKLKRELSIFLSSFVLLGIFLAGCANEPKTQLVVETTPTVASSAPNAAYVTELVLDPVISTTVYISTDGGELWRYSDSNKWTLEDSLQGFSILSLAEAIYKDQVLLYVGTEENGLYKMARPTGSLQGEWEQLALPFDGSVTALDARKAQVIVGTSDGYLYRGRYNRETTSLVWSNQSSGLPRDAYITSIVSTTQDLFVGTNEYGVYRYQSEGIDGQWIRANEGIDSQDITALVAEPVSNALTIYAATNNGVYRTIDSGKTWQAINSGLEGQARRVKSIMVVNNITSTTLFAGTYGGLCYKLGDSPWEIISKHPLLPAGSQMIITALGQSESSIYMGTSGGAGFYILNLTNCKGGISNQCLGWTKFPHLEERALISVHTLVPDTTAGMIYMGTRGNGVLKGALDESEEDQWLNASSGLTDPYVRSLLSLRDALYAGTREQGIFSTINQGASWQSYNDGIISPTLITKMDYLTSPTPILYAAEWGSGLYTKTLEDEIWHRMELGEIHSPWFINDFVVASDSTVYIATEDQGVFQGKGDSHSVQPMNQGLGNITPATDLHLNNDGVLYAVVAKKIYKYDPAEAVWHPIRLNGQLITIMSDPVLPQVIYTAGNTLDVSTDGGKSWSQLLDADAPILAIVVNEGSEKLGREIYLGTEGHGVIQLSIQLEEVSLPPSLLLPLLISGVSLIILGSLIFLILNYPAYTSKWAAINDYPLQQLIPLISPINKIEDVQTFLKILSDNKAFCTHDQVQYALDSLLDFGLMRRKGEGYKLDPAPIAWIHQRLHSREIPGLAKQVRDHHPLYERTRRFFSQANFDIEEISAEEFILIPRGKDHPQAGYGKIYTRFVTGRQPTGNDFSDVEDVVSQRVDEMQWSVAIVLSDQRPKTRARFRLYGIRQTSGLAIVPLDITRLGQVKPGLTPNDILNSEIDQATGKQNLYAISTPVSSDLSFFGREKILRDVIGLLDMGQPVGLFGLRKAGKTSLIQRLQGKLAHRRPVALLDLQGSARQSGVWPLYPAIIKAFIEHISRYRPELSIPSLYLDSTEEPSPVLAEHFISDLRKLHNILGGPTEGEQRLLLILDEIERLLPSEGSPGYEGFDTLLGHLRAANQKERILDVLVVGVDPMINRNEKWMNRDNEFYHALRELWMPPMTQKDTREMIESLGLHMGIEYEDTALEILNKVGGGHPFVTRQVCSLAVDDLLNKGKGVIEVDARRALRAVERFIYQPKSYLGQLWKNRLNDSQREILRRLAEEFRPVPRSQLTPETQQQSVIDDLGMLEEYTLVRQEEEGYMIAWEVLRDWIRVIELGVE